MAATKVFLSYSHVDGEWVWRCLKPCLGAAGVEVLVDRERFRPGRAVYNQMDTMQDGADVNVLVVTKAYLASQACRHEMERAVALDPGFTNGTVIPIRRDDHGPWPPLLARPSPLYVDLRDDADGSQWDLLLTGCSATLGTPVTEWLRARDAAARWLLRQDSVNLVVGSGVEWRPLIDHLRDGAIPQPLVPDLKVIDLESPATASRRGLLSTILRELGVTATLPDKPHDLVEFARLLSALPVSRLAFTHFDYVVHRQAEYELDLFAALRHLIVTEKKLVVLIVSRRPFAALLPVCNDFSTIDVKTVELRARP